MNTNLEKWIISTTKHNLIIWIGIMAKFTKKKWKFLFYLLYNCGQQEKPAVLISGMLLHMRRMYVGSICLDSH